MLPSGTGFNDNRQRFTVEIDKDTTVSWKKLLRKHEKERLDTSPPPGARPALEARIAPEVAGPGAAAPSEGQGRLDSVIEKIERLYKGGGDSDEDEPCTAAPNADDYNTDDSFIDDSDLDDYFEVDGAQTKYSGFFINKGPLESLDQTDVSKGPKKRKKRDPNKSVKRVKVSGQEPQNRTEDVEPKKVSKVSSPGNHKGEDNVDMKRSLSLDGTGNKPSKPKDGSPSKLVEKTIQELEKAVSEFMAKQPEVDPLQPNAVKKMRLPLEVKTKLAKVATLSGKVSDELVERLMKSLGRFMQVKTLKKNLKEMIEIGNEKQNEKQCKVSSFKEEIKDMVNSRILSSSQGARENTGEEQKPADEANSGGCYKWDDATEDRICEFYDFYVEGMDEHKSAPSRKFYTQVAELWPAGSMDNNGIRLAVHRSRERKKGAIKRAKLEEKEVKKRKRLSEATSVKNSSVEAKLVPCSNHSLKTVNVDRMPQEQELSTARKEEDAAIISWDQHPPPPSEAVLSSSLRKIKKERKDCSGACSTWQQQHSLCDDKLGTLLPPEPSC